MENKNICIYPLITMRAMPDERAEMVTQILFGEFFNVLETIERWALVKLLNDGYQGWIDRKLICRISDDDYNSMIIKDKLTVHQPLITIEVNHSPMVIPGGSLLRCNQEESFFTIGTKQVNLPVIAKAPALTGTHAIQLALNYLNAPYLWGGKSILGIDCSGLSQVVYAMLGLQLPRDASQQALTGESVLFIDEAKPGDLAFFDNAEGKITHVGLVMENKKIIHASGSVRIDSLDHQGIYNHDAGKYSHKLRVMKRVLL